MRSSWALSILWMAVGTSPAFGEGRCTGFKWDVSHELALFDASGTDLAAGKSAPSAPEIHPDRLYRVQLVPQAAVAFALEPGRSTAADGAYAGLAELILSEPGNYRVAVDAPLWIDLTANGKLAAVADFQGQPTCDGPHKIVEFDLAGSRRFTLQLSGSATAVVRLTVTRAPPRKL
jgi:hypothetical protein